MLYPEILDRAGSGADRLPKAPPEVRAGLMYTDDGWTVRRHGLVLPDRIACRATHVPAHRFRLHDRPRELVQHCFHHPGRSAAACNVPMFVIGFRPPYVWAMDLSAHEEAIVSLLSYEELLDWFEVGFPMLARHVS